MKDPATTLGVWDGHQRGKQGPWRPAFGALADAAAVEPRFVLERTRIPVYPGQSWTLLKLQSGKLNSLMPFFSLASLQEFYSTLTFRQSYFNHC